MPDTPLEDLLLRATALLQTHAFSEFIPIKRALEENRDLSPASTKWACHNAIVAMELSDAYHTMVVARMVR